jgi:hypothetical protein
MLDSGGVDPRFQSSHLVSCWGRKKHRLWPLPKELQRLPGYVRNFNKHQVTGTKEQRRRTRGMRDALV